jgi:hypothetical protein
VLECVAHGDDVLLARQSHEVAMEDQHDVVATVVVESPEHTVLVGQDDVGGGVTERWSHWSLLGAWSWRVWSWAAEENPPATATIPPIADTREARA